jgi:hypothetical protein
MDVSVLFLVILVLLVISLNANGYLFFKLRRAVKAPQLTEDAQAVVAALASGRAILNIKVLDPGDFFLKSPRG